MTRHYVVILLCGLSSTSFAQELAPADYSPDEKFVIKVVNVEHDGGHTIIVAALGNKSDTPVNAPFDCTLFNKAGDPFEKASGFASTIPPGQEVIEKAYILNKEIRPTKVACRITRATPSN